MLVLSRRATESIRFPQLGISVSIVSVKGSRVQVGIDAPSEIKIIRKELESATQPESWPTAHTGKAVENRPASVGRSEQEQHEFKNRLNQATLGLHLAQKQLAAGSPNAASKTLSTALARLTELEAVAVVVKTSDAESLRHPVPATRPEVEPRVNHVDDQSDECVDILLIEDNQNEQALLRTLLEMEGYRVRTANNGLEAMNVMQHITPKCVLLDMMMPECDGPETLSRMQALPSAGEYSVFAVSATSPDSLGLTVGTSGFDDWFSKPLDAQKLIDRMRERVGITSQCEGPVIESVPG
jgi:carbon storage regulator CsrA